MAIFGIGSHYEEVDVMNLFISGSVACVGWSEKEAPPANAILRHLRTGDIIFIKSFTPQGGLTIKAVGVITDGKVRNVPRLGQGVSVNWVWQGFHRIGKLRDKWPVRSVTIYEEYHPMVQNKVIELLLNSRS